ncbi:TauD/TfdA family dioxygenase [Gammaproteobacteria bacterium]|nr:TauD/TfdA family dioxygenase [Gammaproteobacteria bacterium]
MEITAPSSPSNLGVRIEGLDIGNTLSDKHIQSIRHQWVTFGVAIFPERKLSLEQYENFSQCFGAYGEEPFLIPMREHPHIVKLHRKPDEEAAHFGGAWHSDWSFQSAPPSATMLYSEIIPPIGGDTLFANTADAYDDLTNEVKEKIKDMRCIHSAKLPYAKDGVYATEVKKRTMKIHTSDEANKTMSHPLVRTHKETGRKTLFINPVYTIEIEGLSKADSDILLFELYIHMAQEKYIYRHKWEPNMLIMWDNRTVMHMAEGGYDGHERLLHRITIAGDQTE